MNTHFYLPLDYIGFAAATLYAWCMLALCMYALHSLWLLWRYQRSVTQQRARELIEADHALPENLPRILVQIPVFNERDVVIRAMDAAAQLNWPRDLLEIQILDDSTDDCVQIARTHAQELRQQGVPIQVIHRQDRTGYKAGALEAGMHVSQAEYITIFDADFVPQPDFLKRSIKPLLADAGLALVQGRWEHLNRQENILCTAQAIGIDGHFAIEQGARAWSGLALNFNGTCGIWRRSAIIDAGGWEHDTLTEDMDLSYRAQLKGWRCTFRSDLAVAGEIPNHVDAWRSQQFRWAKGSIQTALKLLPSIWRSSWGIVEKIAATFHMTHYLVHPLMLISLICAPIALGLCPKIPDSILMLGLIAFLVGIGSPLVLYTASQWTLHRWQGLKRMRYFPLLAAIGTGIAISNSRAVSQALRGIPSAFIRTPKKGDKLGSYAAKREHGFAELCCAAWASLGIFWGLSSEQPWVTPLLIIYVSGFAWVGVLSCRSWLQQRKPTTFQSPPLLYLYGCVLLVLYSVLACLPQTWIYASGPYVICGIAISVTYLLAILCIKKQTQISRLGILFIIVCGLGFRLAMLIGMTPSDDLNRYITEGRQAAYAQNPYIYAPHSEVARTLLDAHLDPRITQAVNHPDWTAIYPPLTIGIETLVTHMRSTTMGIKISVFLAEILTLILLSKLLLQRGLPLSFMLLAWWNPVGPIWLSGEGHNDAWMLCFILCGIYFWDQMSHKRGIVMLTCAVLCKPFAAVALLPALLKSPRRYWFIPPALTLLAYYPFMHAGTQLFSSLGKFGSELHFHGALEPIIRAWWKLGLTDEQHIRFAVVATLLGVLFFGSALLIWRDQRGFSFHGRGDIAALIAKLFALLFLCLPTLYPWYFAPVVFLLPFVHLSWGLLLWTAMTPIFWLHGMAIADAAGEWRETQWVTSLAHVPALIWLCSDMVMRSKPWRFIKEKESLSAHA